MLKIMAGASRFLAVNRFRVQRYNKKNEQRKFATRLLLVLLDCYCNATRYSISGNRRIGTEAG